MAAEVVVIGAGLAGLAGADALHRAGHRVTVLEKSRGIGGRLATRHTRDGLAFDHGAPSVHGNTAEFLRFLDSAVAAGRAAKWGDGHIGLPGMSGLAASLAADLAIRFETEVVALERRDQRWAVRWEGGETCTDAVLCTAPAPQTAKLCTALPAIGAAAAAAHMLPGWTLMAAWADLSGSHQALDFAEGPLSRAHETSAKPGRAPSPACWVAHARADWVAANLEMTREEACAALLPGLAARLGAAVPVYAAAHRWRYARVVTPVGRAFVAQDGVAAAGDWLLGPDAGDAHASGRAAAEALIADQAAWRGCVK